MHFEDIIMKKYLTILLLSACLIGGCSNVPLSEEIDGDLQAVGAEINDARQTVQEYSGGLLAILANVRLETLKTTKSMLEQKTYGFRRYIPISYSIDGKGYNPPENKNALLKDLDNDLNDLQKDLSMAEKESAKYGGSLLGVLSLTQVATVENSIAFLNQKRLLLKHDIPYYAIVPASPTDKEPEFEPTQGEDINKF